MEIADFRSFVFLITKNLQVIFARSVLRFEEHFGSEISGFNRNGNTIMIFVTGNVYLSIIINFMNKDVTFLEQERTIVFLK